MLSYAKSASARPGDRLNGFKNSKTQPFNSWGVVKLAYFQIKWSVALRQTHTHAHTLSLSLTHTRTHTLSLSLTHSHTYTHTHTRTHTLSLTHTHTHAVYQLPTYMKGACCSLPVTLVLCVQVRNHTCFSVQFVVKVAKSGGRTGSESVQGLL